MIALALALLLVSPALADQTQIRNYDKARRLHWQKLYPHGGFTFDTRYIRARWLRSVLRSPSAVQITTTYMEFQGKASRNGRARYGRASVGGYR